MTFSAVLPSAIARRLAYVLVCLALAWFSFGGNAYAQSNPDYPDCVEHHTNINGLCPTRDEAYRTARLGAIHWANSVWGGVSSEVGYRVYNKTVFFRLIANKDSQPLEESRSWVSDCPAGTEWFESLQKCDKPCSARNADLSTTAIKWASSGDSQCIAECKYQIASDYQTRAITVTIGGVTTNAGTLHGGVWEYTGDRCPASPPPQPREDEKPKPECTAVTGQSYCMMPSGDACATSSTGRMICWRPSETGTKTDGPNTQTKTNGNESPNPPDGSHHTASQNIVTTTTTNTSSTTINNYTTNSGAPAGSSNQGTNVGTDGKPTGGDGSTPGNGTGGDGDDDGNSSSGGGDCAAPPVSSGDALLAQIAHQAWATRCAISDRNKAQDDEAGELAGQGDGLDGVSEESIFKTFEAGDLREDLLGGSAGMCSFGVPLELMGRPIDLPPSFWSLASWIGMLVTASAYVWVAHKLGG